MVRINIKHYIELTVGSTEEMDNPTVCITLTAEHIAACTVSRSACRIRKLIRYYYSSCYLDKLEMTYPCSFCDWKADSACLQIFNSS